MKKLLLSITGTSAFLAAATPSFAATVELCPTEDSNFASLCNLNLANAIPVLIEFLFIISIIVALFYLIWGGFKWLTSGGDKTAVGAAREHIIAAIIGLVVIFLAYFILNLLLGFFLKGQTASSFTLPQLP